MRLLPGFRFSPTDEELLSFYLKKKMEGDDSEFSHIIREFNVRELEPRDLPEFFFSQPDRMTNSDSCNRTTNEGFYKSIGKVRTIKAEQSQAEIGEKRYMSFYKGRAPQHKKTNYVLHEYSLTKTELAKLGPNPNQQREFVLNHLTTKKRSGDSSCDKLTEPGNSKDDQAAAAAANMIPEPEEHLADKDVLLGSENRNECAGSQFANGSCLIDINDFSARYVGSPGGCFSSGSENLAAHNPFREVSFQPEGNPISPIHPSSLRDIPLRSPVRTGLLGDVVYYAAGYGEHLADKDVLLGSENRNECAESQFANGSCLIDINDFSTRYVGSPGGCFSSGSENLAAYDPFLESQGNPISPIHPTSLRDIPLWSPVRTELLGDVVYYVT